jgi:superfamily II DNA/RNA helicase
VILLEDKNKKIEDVESVVVSSTVLADLFGLTTRRIRMLADEGIIQKTSRGRYNLQENIKSYIVYLKASQDLKEKTVDEDLDPDKERALLTKTQREKLELEIAAMKGKMHFSNDVKRVMSYLPEKRQTLLFSATMPLEINKLAETFLRNPAKVIVTPVASTGDKVNQVLYYVDKVNKIKLLLEIFKNKEMGSTLIFTRTKHGANKLSETLNKNGIMCAAIHGNKSQSARQQALSNFKSGDINVLVATDIAARGIDIKELSHVVNYEIPNVPETYVHRIGRTARAGLGGSAISLCDYDEVDYIFGIERLIKKEIEVISDHPFPMLVKEKSPKPIQQNRPQKNKPVNTGFKNFNGNNQNNRSKQNHFYGNNRNKANNNRFNKKTGDR